MGASPSHDWSSTRSGGHVLPRRAALGAGRDPAGKLSDVAAAHSPAGAMSPWRPKGASSGALQAFPKPPIQGQRRSRRVDLTSNCVLKCRCFPLANVDGPLHRETNRRNVSHAPRHLACLRLQPNLLVKFISVVCSTIFLIALPHNEQGDPNSDD